MARLSVVIIFLLALAAIAEAGTSAACADGELCTYLPAVQGGAPAQPTAVPATPTRDPAICDPSYPTVCIPPPPDLNCADIPYRRFPVVGSDPHTFDSDNDGIGCEGA